VLGLEKLLHAITSIDEPPNVETWSLKTWALDYLMMCPDGCSIPPSYFDLV